MLSGIVRVLLLLCVSSTQMNASHLQVTQSRTEQIRENLVWDLTNTSGTQLASRYTTVSHAPNEQTPLTGNAPAEHPRMVNISQSKDASCKMEVAPKSIRYFKHKLSEYNPNFMHIKIQMSDSHPFNATPDTFRPNHWVWTYYKASSGLYPYLNWNIDYGILSFGLLDANTLQGEPFVLLTVAKECVVTFGTRNTTVAVAEALLELIEQLTQTDGNISKYDDSYFCYLAVAPNIRDTILYRASTYLLYPINYINYNCCRTGYNYIEEEYRIECLNQQVEKWVQCAQGPFFLGIVIFFYFPILLFEMCGWMSKDEPICHSMYELPASSSSESVEDGQHNPNINHVTTNDTEWLFLDGVPPRSFLDLFSVFWCGLKKTHPVLVSRIRRLVCVLLTPSIIFIQLLVYYFNMKPEIMQTLIKKQTPMGFVSLLGDRNERSKAFVPLLGGPVCILIMYYILGITFVVFPTSLKQIVENGLPRNSRASDKSPLCLDTDDIIELSMVTVKAEPGYRNAANLCRCSIYLIFSKRFWAKVWQIQAGRTLDRNYGNTACVVTIIKLIFMPIYVILCFLEILLCIMVYGIPFFTFVSVMVKGATRALMHARDYGLQGNKLIHSVLSNPVAVFVETVIVFAMFLFFAYSVCLIFVQSFSFLSQIAVFCFVAVIVYPSVAFGYLFFFIVLLYYVVRLIRDFGYGYLELLSEAVEIARNMDGQPNCVSTFDGILTISNVKAFQIRNICINNKHIQIPQNVLQSIFENAHGFEKVKVQNNMFGIPNRLFEVLIQKHRPVHQQVLKIVLHLILITLLLVITMSITAGFVTGPTSEISDVMHVIFIVVVGALPRVLEVAMMNASESVTREIELRHIEQTIVEYWQKEECLTATNVQ